MIDTVASVEDGDGLIEYLSEKVVESLSKDKPDQISDSGACEGCGNCCEVFTLNNTRDEIERKIKERKILGREKKWFEEDIVEITGSDVSGVLKEHIIEMGLTLYRCTIFDPVEKRCTDYENRPITCRTFPLGTMKKKADGSYPGTIYESCELFDELAAERK